MRMVVTVLMEDCNLLNACHGVRFPKILLRGHWVTKLIIKHYCEQANHSARTNFLLQHVQTKEEQVATICKSTASWALAVIKRSFRVTLPSFSRNFRSNFAKWHLSINGSMCWITLWRPFKLCHWESWLQVLMGSWQRRLKWRCVPAVWLEAIKLKIGGEVKLGGLTLSSVISRASKEWIGGLIDWSWSSNKGGTSHQHRSWLNLLPKVHLRFTFHPFDLTAVDYTGPFTTVQGRGVHH